MSLQGPILIVADEPAMGLAQALTAAGAFPIIETTLARCVDGARRRSSRRQSWRREPGTADAAAATALAQKLAKIAPIVPMVVRLRDDKPCALADAVTVAEDAAAERLIARLAGRRCGCARCMRR